MIRALIIVVLSITISIVGITFYLQPNDFRSCDDTPVLAGDCSPVDAIIAVSGGDTNARTDRAIQLYKNGWADQLIFSGAAQDKSGPSNAQAMAMRAEAAGVPADAIALDEYAETTAENALNSQSIFESKGIQTIILVTSAYHQRRASLEFNQRTTDVVIKNYPTDDQDWNGWWWLTPRGWWLAGGEMVKIAVFYVRGATGL